MLFSSSSHFCQAAISDESQEVLLPLSFTRFDQLNERREDFRIIAFNDMGEAVLVCPLLCGREHVCLCACVVMVVH